MATANDISRSFLVNAAMSAGSLVAVSSNAKLDLNAINKFGIGVLIDDVTAGTYENPKVRLWGAGTVRVSVTGTPLTSGDLLYAVTGGQVAGTNGFIGNTNGGRIVGSLVETTGASQNGNLFEMAMFTTIGT